MCKLPALVVLVAAALLPGVADACRRMAPSADALEQYSAIFVGRVTGLHLVGYENGLIGNPDLLDPTLGAITITNGANPVALRVAVTQPIRSASGALELGLAGCTFDVPDLKDRGIFFVQPDGESALVVWEQDQSSYKQWLKQLGVADDGR